MGLLMQSEWLVFCECVWGWKYHLSLTNEKVILATTPFLSQHLSLLTVAQCNQCIGAVCWPDVQWLQSKAWGDKRQCGERKKIRPPSNSVPFPDATDGGVWNGWLIGDGALNGAVWRRFLLLPVTWYVLGFRLTHAGSKETREKAQTHSRKHTNANSSSDWRAHNSSVQIQVYTYTCCSSCSFRKSCLFIAQWETERVFLLIFWLVCLCSTNTVRF